jgi:cardiolipin synthase C
MITEIDAFRGRVMRALIAALLLGAWLAAAGAQPQAPMGFIDAQIAARPGQSGAYVLETGAHALIARYWLADHARESIEVQYFIWSTDNVGILGAEALLRAAERGVRVRVIVDALLIDAPDESLLALARHPQVDIRIYNPKKLWSLVGDFRGFNQRMHDKTLIVDGKIAITGGRNMAAEYYDYNQEYNFRDRDVLLLGEVVKPMRASFERFWESPLAVKAETLSDHVRLDDGDVRRIYRELHAYAASPGNFSPEVRTAIAAAPNAFEALAREVVWGKVEFISDMPGKNEARGLRGGGATAAALGKLVEGARSRLVIQSPYLVASDRALELLRQARARGVRVSISTNSLASTDNIPAFGGYRNQRQRLLDMGLEIHEYRPDPEVQRELMRRSPTTQKKPPVFALHAKTLVVDGRVVYIGTFNFDPRSENLNTEVGVIIDNERLARAVQAAIETDMRPANSWNAATDDPDAQVGFFKRSRTRFWQLMPIKPLL